MWKDANVVPADVVAFRWQRSFCVHYAAPTTYGPRIYIAQVFDVYAFRCATPELHAHSQYIVSYQIRAKDGIEDCKIYTQKHNTRCLEIFRMPARAHLPPAHHLC